MRRLLVVAALLILFAAACGEAAPVDATNPPPAEVTSVDEAGPLRSCFPFNPTFADPYSVPGRFAVIGTWMETPASSLATSNGVEAVVFDEQDYLRFADLPALLQQSTVLWSKPDFELDTLHMKPEAAPAIDSLSDEIVFVGVSNFWTGGQVHMSCGKPTTERLRWPGRA